MGGRGAMMKPQGQRKQEYEAVGFIAGFKVLERLDKRKEPNLPLMSNTPGTGYIVLLPNKNFKQFRQYGKDRNPVLDIDFDHDHGYGIPHVHIWDGQDRVSEGRSLTEAEKKRYWRVLEAAHGRH